MSVGNDLNGRHGDGVLDNAPEDVALCNRQIKVRGTIASLPDMPKVEAYQDDKIVICGMPVLNEGGGVTELLQWYKRLLTTGKMGRSKEEHAELMSEAVQRYNVTHAKQLWRIKRAHEVAFISYLCCNDVEEKVKWRRILHWLPDMPKQVLVLPDDVNFTLPITYEVKALADENSGEPGLLVRLRLNTAAYATERLDDNELRILPTHEAECWLKTFRDMLVYDIRAMFEDIDRAASSQARVPNYNEHSAFTERLKSFSSIVGKPEKIS